jgi:hypothetical protein
MVMKRRMIQFFDDGEREIGDEVDSEREASNGK